MSGDPSETSKCRDRLGKYCRQPILLDIGFGGDAIAEHAICVDLPPGKRYAFMGKCPQHINRDVLTQTLPFKPRTVSTIFSSHLIEDFAYLDQIKILRHWLSVLKSSGLIVLYQPDEQVYLDHCRRTGQGINLNHKNPDYSLEAFKSKVVSCLRVSVLHQDPQVDTYSWEIVLRKLR